MISVREIARDLGVPIKRARAMLLAAGVPIEPAGPRTDYAFVEEGTSFMFSGPTAALRFETRS